MLDSDIFRFIEKCNVCPEPDFILDELLIAAADFGFQHLIMSGVPAFGQEASELVDLNGWPKEWFRRYSERNYAEVDGVCRYAASTHVPFYWREVPSALRDTKGSRQVRDEAAEFDIRSGFAIPFLSLNHWQSVISFASPERDLVLGERDRLKLVTIATCAGGAAETLLYGRAPEVYLSPREKEILLWIAAGKSAWECGEIVGVSEATVKMHLARVRSRFGVATTMQAVLHALRRRTIMP